MVDAGWATPAFGRAGVGRWLQIVLQGTRADIFITKDGGDEA